jgi:hypothetical protein
VVTNQISHLYTSFFFITNQFEFPIRTVKNKNIKMESTQSSASADQAEKENVQKAVFRFPPN